jgi:general nucleoside transport system ATP-binding protein
MTSTMSRLELTGISKAYPAVKANDGVNLRVEPGEIHAVLGENGAGKSTLMKIIYGAAQPDEGEIRWNGQPVHIASPAHARSLGISMVYQHFSLFDTLTAAENVWLGLDRSESLYNITQRIRSVSAQYGLEVDPHRRVHTLSVGERQRVEIVRALMTQPQLLILDEPTSVLTPQAVDRLFETLRRLARDGCAILYISHKLDEIRALCDRCTVMRAGRVTGEVRPAEETNESLSRLMLGSEPPGLTHRPVSLGAVALEVAGLSLSSGESGASERAGAAQPARLQDIRLQVRAGEILGIAGVSGNGQQELLALLSGEDRRAAADTIRLEGAAVGGTSPAHRRSRGLHMVPEERLGRGAVPSMSLSHNTLLTRWESVSPRGWLRLKDLERRAAGIIDRFRVKASGPQAAARSLSGGNLQKFIMGREIDAKPRVLIVSQPTWGVDVGAAALIRAELIALREAGAAVLVVSEELDELFEISDRLMVIAQGRLSPSIPVAEATRERIGQWMSGLWEGAEHVAA